MKKRKIFDIEKVGFGDEVTVSPAPKPISKNESKVMIQPTVKPIVKSVVDRPQAILSPEVNVKKERHISTSTQPNSSRMNTSSSSKASGYKPVEFVSPISGRRIHQPKTVHLAHGQYQLSTASMVEENKDKPLVEEVQIETHLRDEGSEVVSVLNDELHELFESEDEAQVCPSFTTANDAIELEKDETTIDRPLSDETEDIIVVNNEKEIVEEVPMEDVDAPVTHEIKDGLLSDIASEVKELAETIVETINKAQGVLDVSERDEVDEVTPLTEEAIDEMKEEITSLEEITEEVIIESEEGTIASEVNDDEALEKVAEVVAVESDDEIIGSEANEDEVLVEESDGEIAKSVASIAQSSQELELDDVLSLLNEEEKAPSIFEALLSEDEAHQEQVSDLGIDDVLTLLQEEEKQTSLLDQILNHSQEQASLEETLSDEIEDEMFTEEDESEFFDDENFCDEVLEQVRIEEEEVEAIYYETPPLSLLKEPTHSETMDEEWIVNKMEILEQTFLDFGVKVRLTGEYTQGPTVTQIEIQPESGTKLNKITGLSDDLKLSLSVDELRIEPIPGKNTIGVEIPNPKRKMVFLKEILSKPEFILHESPLCIGLGQDVSGQPVYADISTMPHGLIAGQTGSGKSVCINTLLVSMLYKASPEDVRVMLVDPKRVELAPYNAIPHLITPVICDERKAAQGLKWAVDEMERRYELFATNGVRDIKSFNERRHEFEMSYAKLPYILIVIDELADLMMVSAQEVEDCIMRITQKARAAGIHLIVATQRPTVDVITGTIKSNIPSRIAFAVAQANDSRVILDETGAQNLLGQGDMLWSSSGSKVKRVQGAYISSDEIDAIVACVKQQGKPKYLISDEVFQKGSSSIQSDTDPLLYDAMNFIFDRGHATVSSLQTRLRIGFNRAARIIDTLEMNGWIGEPQGAQKQREIKISREEFEAMKDQTRF